MADGLHPVVLSGLREVHGARRWPRPPQATADSGDAERPVPADRTGSVRLPLRPALARRTSWLGNDDSEKTDPDVSVVHGIS